MTKRLFDIVFALLIFFFFGIIIFLFWILAAIDTESTGLFLQERVGQYGKPFIIFKLRTFHAKTGKISVFGQFLRKYKLDELLQFINVLKGEMSIVGPRPDVSGYYDKLLGDNRKILELKPGITCEASIKYYNEETLLAQQENALHYNDTVIFPDKVRMNLDYYYHKNLLLDIKIILKTILKSKY